MPAAFIARTFVAIFPERVAEIERTGIGRGAHHRAGRAADGRAGPPDCRLPRRPLRPRLRRSGRPKQRDLRDPCRSPRGPASPSSSRAAPAAQFFRRIALLYRRNNGRARKRSASQCGDFWAMIAHEIRLMTKKEIAHLRAPRQGGCRIRRPSLLYSNPFHAARQRSCCRRRRRTKSVNKATAELFKVADTPKQDGGARREAGSASYIKTIGLYRVQGEERPSRCPKLLSREPLTAKCRATATRSKRCRASAARPPMSCFNVASAKKTIAVDTHIFRVSNRTGVRAGKTRARSRTGLVRKVPDGIRAARPSLADPARALYLRRAQAAVPELHVCGICASLERRRGSLPPLEREGRQFAERRSEANFGEGPISAVCELFLPEKCFAFFDPPSRGGWNIYDTGVARWRSAEAGRPHPPRRRPAAVTSRRGAPPARSPPDRGRRTRGRSCRHSATAPCRHPCARRPARRRRA